MNSPHAESAVYLASTRLSARNITIEDVRSSSGQGAGIFCYNCLNLQVEDSLFRNLSSSFGGAVFFL